MTQPLNIQTELEKRGWQAQTAYNKPGIYLFRCGKYNKNIEDLPYIPGIELSKCKTPESKLELCIKYIPNE